MKAGIFRYAGCVALAVFWFPGSSPQARAIAISSSEISVSNLEVSPSGGSLVVLSASTFAQAQNSQGDLVSQFDSSGGAASANAVVPFASAQAQAAGLNSSANAQVTIPALVNIAANSQGLSSLVATFMITGGVGPVDVTFGALVDYALSVLTDGNGLLAEAETIFQLQVDGTPVLAFNDLLSVGPSASQSSSAAVPLTGTLTLQYDQEYTAVVTADAEARGFSVPDSFGRMSALSLVGMLTILAGQYRQRPQPGT